jgi:hypothetical protein
MVVVELLLSAVRWTLRAALPGKECGTEKRQFSGSEPLI